MANNLAFSMLGMFLLIYYTNVVGLDPAGVAVVLLGVRILGAFSDLVAGRLVDLTNTRWGRFRPYLVFASPPLLLMSVATFTVPSFGGDQAWQYAYAAVTLSLLGMLYSIVTIPVDCVPGCETVGAIRCKEQGVRQECALDDLSCPAWKDGACPAWSFCLREDCESLPAIDATATHVEIGIMLQGPGVVWFDDPRLEILP